MNELFKNMKVDLSILSDFHKSTTGKVEVNELQNENEVKIYKKAQNVAAVLTDFLTEMNEIATGNIVVNNLNKLFDIDGITVTASRSCIPRLLDKKIEALKKVRGSYNENFKK